MAAFEEIKEHIKTNNSFVLEAGAGAGKTYTLIQTLNHLIEEYENELILKHQNIVCITYTNVAKNEILERMGNNPLVLVSTIHEFLWSSINSYQKQLKEQLIVLNQLEYEKQQIKFEAKSPKDQAEFKFKIIENLNERISDIREVSYSDSKFGDYEQGRLGHDDIITLSKLMFENYSLLIKIVLDKYPYILVDEYQDTAEETVNALINSILHGNQKKILFGFYGDSHQKIYAGGIGSLQEYINKGLIKEVKKEENFRSSSVIVDLLNEIRTNITQKSQINIENSEVKLLYYVNPPREKVTDAKGKEKDEPITHYEKRIQPFKDEKYNIIISLLEDSFKWELHDGGKDKILILTNSKVAGRAGFGALYKVYDIRYGRSQRTKQQLLDREHAFIQLFVGSYDKKTSIERQTGIEHLCESWRNKNYHKVISFIKKQGNADLVTLQSHEDKERISILLDTLCQKRSCESVKNVIEYVTTKGLIKLSDRIREQLELIGIDLEVIENEEEKKRLERNRDLIVSLLDLPYNEIVNLYEHIQNHTVFSTKHGTKGEEFRNVLVVLDDTEWKQEYNFNLFFNNTDENPKRLEMTKNLFYVSCSRAKENLVVLMLSSLESSSMGILHGWFGVDNVIDVDEYLQEQVSTN